MSTNQVNVVVVAAPPNQITTANNLVADGVGANGKDSDPGQTLAYSATGLPDGISIDINTGVFSGMPTTVADAVTVTVTATDSTGSSGSDTFTWTVVEPPQIVVNMDR